MYDLRITENDLLLVIDMQEDFIYGPLGTPEAQAIVLGIAELIRNFRGRKIFTQDTHGPDYLETQEGRRLPVPHCILGTPGHRIVEPIRKLISGDDTVILKNTFGSITLGEMIRKGPHAQHIYVCGVCTGICDISNAIIAKTADPEAEICILSYLCACVTPESHKTALDAMRMLQMVVL